MLSKSQNYVEIAYKMLGKFFFEMKNFKVLKIIPTFEDIPEHNSVTNNFSKYD